MPYLWKCNTNPLQWQNCSIWNPWWTLSNLFSILFHFFMFALEILCLNWSNLFTLFVFIAYTLIILYPTSITNIINNLFWEFESKSICFSLKLNVTETSFLIPRRTIMISIFLSLLRNVFFKAFVPTFSNFPSFCSVWFI